MPAPGEISGVPGSRSQTQTAAGPQPHAAGRTELTGPGAVAPIALGLPGGGCRRAHLQGACTAAGRCHEVTAVRKAARNWQPAAEGANLRRGGGARARWAGAGKNAIPQRACPRPRGVSWRRLSISERCSCSTLPVWGRRRACPPLAQLGDQLISKLISLARSQVPLSSTPSFFARNRVHSGLQPMLFLTPPADG